MAEVAKRYQNELETLKESVESWYQYFKMNYDTFHKTRGYVFRSTLSADDISVLENLKKPQLEFNILETYVSRLMGEFSKQMPSLKVTSAENAQVDPQTIDIVEQHTRSIMFNANNNGAEYHVYGDLLSGGFSAIKVWTDYENEMSFHQNIHWDRCFDPTMTGFDPLARAPHKGDGNFCYEVFPKRKSEFEREYPGVDLKGISFVRHLSNFNWSYNNQAEDILLLCDYYKKKKKNTKIVQLSNGKVLTRKKYDEFILQWEAAGHIEQPAQIVSERTTQIETICRYRFIENQLLSYEETDFKFLPIIFVDGNSHLLRDATGSSISQFTRPYVYNAIGAQKLKNYAGQSLANELENMVQHKFMISKEAIPLDYLMAWKKPQLPSVLVYNEFLNNDPTVRLTPPREVQRPPIPQEVSSSFMMTDQLVQTILGSYDASLGINNNQLSGVAIVEGATQSNAAAMPYVVGFLQALTQVGQIIVDLLPKYYVTPRTIPIMGGDGKKESITINQPGGITFNYGENALKVRIEAGVNFSVQKTRALQQITSMIQASPLFAQFMMYPQNLEALLDNIEVRGIDQLKANVQPFFQYQQQQQQNAMQNNPLMAKAHAEQMKAQNEAQSSQQEGQFRAVELTNQTEDIKNDRLRILLDAHQANADSALENKKADVEVFARGMDMAMKAADMKHQHAHDDAKLVHDVVKSAPDPLDNVNVQG